MDSSDIEISQKFSLGGLVRFTAPSVAMLAAVSLFTMVDGVFIARYVGSDALAALNLVLPLDYLTYGLALMLGSGGSAIIGRKLGEGKVLEARRNFALITLTALAIGLAVTGVVLVWYRPIARALGVPERLMGLCADYGLTLACFCPFEILSVMNDQLFLTAGKPRHALRLTLFCGSLNAALDYLFIVRMGMGLTGAALGTGISRLIGGTFPVLHFTFTKGALRYARPRLDWHVVAHTLTNGSSEMVTNLAGAVTTFLFNVTILRIAGEDGVAAVSIILYAQYLFNSAFFGFASGVAPVFSYHYGRRDTDYLKKLFRRSLCVVAFGTAAVMGVIALSAAQVVAVFAPEGSRVFSLTHHGIFIFLWGFCFSGLNIFASALFSAFSNGAVSALISFLRTLLFISGAVLVLPAFFGLDGLWLAVPAAELLSALVALPLMLHYGRRTYFYI